MLDVRNTDAFDDWKVEGHHVEEINELYSSLEEKMDKNDIRYEMQVDSCPLKINTTGITQVLNNLVENAIRYYKGNLPIMIRGECLDDEYKIMMISEDSYIPREEKERIFERFYRVEHSLSRALGGSGLGLAISKEIVERHNGQIGLQSKGNVYSFWVTLPLSS